MIKLKLSNMKGTYLRSYIWKTRTDNQIYLDLNPKPKGFCTRRPEAVCTNIDLCVFFPFSQTVSNTIVYPYSLVSNILGLPRANKICNPGRPSDVKMKLTTLQ